MGSGPVHPTEDEPYRERLEGEGVLGYAIDKHLHEREQTPVDQRASWRVGDFLGRVTGLHRLLRWLAKFDDR